MLTLIISENILSIFLHTRDRWMYLRMSDYSEMEPMVGNKKSISVSPSIL